MLFKKGSIRKVTVHNFVTYSYAELHPGPNLNMLIGPNGTGKSTIVAAIILGLGGNPKTVGRGHKVSEYVKHNCEDAYVTIDLFVNECETVSITRQFNLRDKSSWKLNGKEVSYKEIDKVIKQFNIQVDNLCQFLPQDKVADFAKMNKQQLLHQTQLAVCRNDLIEKHQNLIKKREKHKELNDSLSKHNQKLRELNDANVRIEGKIKNLKKRKKFINQIEHIDRKISWLKYESSREKVDVIKNKKNSAAKILEKHQNSYKPIENALQKANMVINKLQDKAMNNIRQVREAENFTNTKIEKYEVLKTDLNKITEEMNNNLQQIKNHENEIKTTSDQIKNWKSEKEKFLEKYHSEEKIDEKIQNYNSSMRKFSSQINRLVDNKNEKENLKRQAMYEARVHENDLNRLENVKEQRMQWLSRVDKDAHNAVRWLRSNKDIFKGDVFEPMMLELNVKNQNDAIFVENSVPMRDKLAFTCTNKEDMNLLIRTMRDKEKLNINVIYSGEDGFSVDSFKPRLPISQLKHLGLNVYVKDLVSGPAPIIKYLCKNYQIHNIPVGNGLTNSKYEEVPKQITNFFSDKYHFSTTFSKYTGAKSVRQSEIRSDGSLSISIDTERIETVRSLYADNKKICERYTQEQQEIEKQISELNDKKMSLQQGVTTLQENKKMFRNIESKIRIFENKLSQLQTISTNVEEIEKNAKKKIKEVISKMVDLQKEIHKSFKAYSEAVISAELERVNLESSRKQSAILSNKLLEVRKSCEEAEKHYNEVKGEYHRITTEAKIALRKAKELSNGFIPTDDGFEEFREAYEALSDDIEELESDKETILSKIDCLNTANDGELNEFEERQRNILITEELIRNQNAEFEQLAVEMDQLQEKWLQPLRQLVEEINAKFSASFKQMGCEGEVEIYVGNNEKDFAEYGLSIKVKYRHSEPLQELNSAVQSGGERAVATAVFMLSLQEITPVPFRCVDEINQGMDAENERRIFELLVDTTGHENTSQYFLITPKLVPGLKFIPTMKIHNVHNGPFVPSQEEWNKSKGI